MTSVQHSIQCPTQQDTAQLRHQVDSVTEELCRPWDGVINFLACPLVKGVDTFPTFQMTFTLLNICAYLGGKMSPVTHLYFDPALYPPPPRRATLDLNKYEPWLNLKRDLIVAAHEEGNPIPSRPAYPPLGTSFITACLRCCKPRLRHTERPCAAQWSRRRDNLPPPPAVPRPDLHGEHP